MKFKCIFKKIQSGSLAAKYDVSFTVWLGARLKTVENEKMVVRTQYETTKNNITGKEEDKKTK